MMAGETIEYRCLARYQGLWAPYISYWDNMGSWHPGVNSTTDTEALFSVPLTVDIEDTDLMLEARLQFQYPPDGALPPSSDQVSSADNFPSYRTEHQFDAILVYCK